MHQRIYNVINRSAAQSVTKHSKYQVIGKLMKESTPVTDHSAAKNAKAVFITPCINLFNTYLSIYFDIYFLVNNNFNCENFLTLMK